MRSVIIAFMASLLNVGKRTTVLCKSAGFARSNLRLRLPLHTCLRTTRALLWPGFCFRLQPIRHMQSAVRALPPGDAGLAAPSPDPATASHFASCESALRATKAWMESVVIGFGLCPWGQRLYEKGDIRFVCTEASTATDLFMEVLGELDVLQQHAGDDLVETTLLVAPRTFPDDFSSFRHFVKLVEKFLQRQDLYDVYQVITFHPGFQFKGHAIDNVSNYVNRSPYPMVHLLRQKSIRAAIRQNPQLSEELPFTNRQRLSKLGLDRMKQLVAAARDQQFI